MQKNIFRKSLVIGVIVILICVSTTPIIENVQAEGYEVGKGTIGVIPGGETLARTSDGNLHCVYHRSDGQHFQIYHSFSTNNGETWTEEEVTAENYDQIFPALAIDSNNYLHVVWQGCHSGSPTHPQIRYKVYTTQWSPITTITTDINWDQRTPAIAIDNNNNLHVIWQKIEYYGWPWSTGGIGPTFYSKKTGSSWSTPVMIGEAHEYNEVYASIVIDKYNYIHVAWTAGGYHNGACWHSAYRRFTTYWEPVYSFECYVRYPSLATDSTGTVHLAYCLGAYSNQVIYRQRTISTSWSSPVVIAPYSYSYFLKRPSISVDSNNYVYVVWDDADGDIRCNKYTSSWQGIETLITDTDSHSPYLISCWHPEVNGVRTNIPEDGYAFLWMDGSIIKFYKSQDLTWEGDGNQPLVVEIDFETINYGLVLPGTRLTKHGDYNMNTPNLPTIHNTGNAPVKLKIMQNDMGFGKRLVNGEEKWNVEYNARLSKDGIYTPIYYPGEEVEIPGVLGVGVVEKLDFLINVIVGFPNSEPYVGSMILKAVQTEPPYEETSFNINLIVNIYADENEEGAPIIKCIWEYDMDVEVTDYDDDAPPACLYHDACPYITGLQVKTVPGGNVKVGYYAIVTDPQGVGHIDNVYVDVWHPNGEFKYQFELFPVGLTSGGYDKQPALDAWTHVYNCHPDQIKVNDGWAASLPPGNNWMDDVYNELNHEHAFLYYGWAKLSYFQPTGYYCVGVRAVDGLQMWSDYLKNQFEYFSGNQPIIYDREAAYDYAQKYWDEVCSDGYFWDSSGTYISLLPGTDITSMTGYDCAHFVSCCIGSELHEQGGGLDITSRVPPTYGEPGAVNLGNWLVDSGNAIDVASINEMQKGDVIIYTWTSGGHHAALYLGNGMVAAHTTCVWNFDWQLDPSHTENYRFVHIIVSSFTIDVSPAYSTVNVDNVVTFTGSITDNYGNGIPDILVSVDDPIKEVYTSTQTDINGDFTYSVSATRPGEFQFRFYVASLSQVCTIHVQRLGTSWSSQTLTVTNTEPDSYNMALYVNNQNAGNWVVLPGQSINLWQASDPLTSNSLAIETSNLRTGDVYNIDANSISEYHSTYYPGISDIPLNPQLCQYNILTTDSIRSQTYMNLDVTSQNAASTIPIQSSGSSQNGLIKVEAGVGHGPDFYVGPEVNVGCSVFIGLKVECSADCGISGGLMFGFKLGLAFPIEPFFDAGCGWGCKIVAVEGGCSAGASVSAQAGYEAGGEINARAYSPVNIVIFDSVGRQVGYNPNMEYAALIRYIPGATYSGAGTEPQEISISIPITGDYTINAFGTGTGPYTVIMQYLASDGTVINSISWTGNAEPGEKYTKNIRLTADGTILDITPPTTFLTVGEPKFGTEPTYVSTETTLTLGATDDLSGVNKTYYRIWYNNIWTPLIEYNDNFKLTGEGKHYIEYYSVDNAGNAEEIHNQTHFVVKMFDINNDGKINFQDSLIIFAHRTSKIGFYENWFDLNNDGVVDSKDAELVWDNRDGGAGP